MVSLLVWTRNELATLLQHKLLILFLDVDFFLICIQLFFGSVQIWIWSWTEAVKIVVAFFLCPVQIAWPPVTPALDIEGLFLGKQAPQNRAGIVHGNNSCFHWLVPLSVAQGQLITEMHCCREWLKWETLHTWLHCKCHIAGDRWRLQ